MLYVERKLPRELLPKLESLGHEVKRIGSAGVVQAIAAGPDGKLLGVHDPRVPGKAAGW